MNNKLYKIQNNSMNSTIIFLSIIFIILSVMLVFKIKISFNLLQNNCKVIVCLFGINIVKIDINLISLTFEINNSKKKKSLNIFLTHEQEYFIKQIKSTILDKLYYDDIIVDYKIGLINPNVSALMCGLIDCISKIVTLKLISLNSDTNIIVKNECDFNSLNFDLNMQVKVYFTLFDLLFALIISFYKRGMYAKQRK